ncbi:unnamed protein product [Umbelopsis vinacea]
MLLQHWRNSVANQAIKPWKAVAVQQFRTKPEPLLMVIGGTVMDITSTFSAESFVDIKSPSSYLHTSCPGIVRQSLGGVGRNVAEAAFRAGAETLLVSAVGDDLASTVIMDGLKKSGMIYNALHAPDGQLISAVADMNVFKNITAAQVLAAIETYPPNLICCDGNLEPSVLCETAPTLLSGSFTSTSPNQHELVAMSNTAKKLLPPVDDKSITDQITAEQLKVITKLGQYGCLLSGQSNGKPILRYFEAHSIRADQIKNVTGAGDRLQCLEQLEDPYWQDLIFHSQTAAIRTLQSHDAVAV